MVKNKTQFEILSYGIHSKWDADSKALPKVRQFTSEIPAEIDIEFGFIINIKKAKGNKVRYCIYHPNIPDDNGEPMAPFDGEEYIRSNDWDFYLGDTIWAPIENKLGEWRMTLELDGNIIADKTFEVMVDDHSQDTKFWKQRIF